MQQRRRRTRSTSDRLTGSRPERSPRSTTHRCRRNDPSTGITVVDARTRHAQTRAEPLDLSRPSTPLGARSGVPERGPSTALVGAPERRRSSRGRGRTSGRSTAVRLSPCPIASSARSSQARRPPMWWLRTLAPWPSSIADRPPRVTRSSFRDHMPPTSGKSPKRTQPRSSSWPSESPTPWSSALPLMGST
jgi:hypothetical protein